MLICILNIRVVLTILLWSVTGPFAEFPMTRIFPAFFPLRASFTKGISSSSLSEMTRALRLPGIVKVSQLVTNVFKTATPMVYRVLWVSVLCIPDNCKNASLITIRV